VTTALFEVLDPRNYKFAGLNLARDLDIQDVFRGNVSYFGRTFLRLTLNAGIKSLSATLPDEIFYWDFAS
jgi:hypothetical protein